MDTVYALNAQSTSEASPVLRVLTPKSNRGTRPLGIPTIFDRCMQALHFLSMNSVAEVTADPNFIKGISQEHAIAALRETMKGYFSPSTILDI
jgi:RNA-directed DNA polymerase